METKIRIIIADANPDFCKLLTDLTSAEEDMEVVGTASDGIEALAMYAGRIYAGHSAAGPGFAQA